MSDRPPTPTGDGATTSRRRRRVVAVAALAVGAAALLVPKSAGAGSYMVRQCTATNPGAQASWERTSDHYRNRVRCRSSGGLQVHHEASATAHRHHGAWAWRAPAGTIFTSLRVNASLAHHAGHRGELWAASVGGREHRFGGEHRPRFRVYEQQGELSSLVAKLRCTRPAGCGRAAEDRAHTYVKGVFLRVADRTAPTVRSMSGTLLDDKVVRGRRTLAFAATDRGGGVRRVSIEANGVTLAGAVRDCHLRGRSATRLVPCPGSTTETRTVLTSHPAFATGPNVVAACADDLAFSGRPNRGCERRSVWVDNVCPASGPAGASLDAGFSGGELAVVRSDRRAMLTGRLVDDLERPVAGATICVLSRVERDGALVTIAATEPTGTDGRYAIELPSGPSRRVFVHHVHGSEVIARHGLAIRSRVRPALTVRAPRRARRGDWLRFRGRLPGPACAGRLVEVQARLGKRHWQVFRTSRTGDRCRFATRYRLRATTRPTRYRFRARVRRQPGYPYAPGRSAVRTTRVAG
jgi:hypothetical protein